MPDVDDPPVGVSSDVWVGSSGPRPAVGELWLLSWNGERLGLALVSGISNGFAMVWPATLPSEPAFPPALALANSPLDIALNIWPTRETGVGFHLFDRHFGGVLSRVSMGEISEAVDEGRTPSLPFVNMDFDPQQAENESDRMIDHWEDICLNVWPETVAGRSPFASAALDRANLGIQRIQELLSIDIPQAIALYRGELLPTRLQVEALSVDSGLDADRLLLSIDDGVRLINSPIYKRRFVELVSRLNLDERELRDLARQDLGLAARSDGDLANRLLAVLDRLGAVDE